MEDRNTWLIVAAAITTATSTIPSDTVDDAIFGSGYPEYLERL
jgi:hypothetical protein